MKRLGLIGSMNADSPLVYWRTIHDEARLSLDEEGPANILVHCNHAARLRGALRREDWPGVRDNLIEAGRELKLAGAQCLVVCGSALNPVGPEVRQFLEMPLVDMAHAVAFKIQKHRFRKVALLGAQTDRERDMWHERLTDIALLEPTSAERAWLLQVVPATARGDTAISCKIEIQRIISSMRKGGAQAIVLADHALGRWITSNETLLPIFDAEEIHAWIAAVWALETNLMPGPPCVLR